MALILGLADCEIGWCWNWPTLGSTHFGIGLGDFQKTKYPSRMGKAQCVHRSRALPALMMGMGEALCPLYDFGRFFVGNSLILPSTYSSIHLFFHPQRHAIAGLPQAIVQMLIVGFMLVDQGPKLLGVVQVNRMAKFMHQHIAHHRRGKKE
jgi:hypothetical protein